MAFGPRDQITMYFCIENPRISMWHDFYSPAWDLLHARPPCTTWTWKQNKNKRKKKNNKFANAGRRLHSIKTVCRGSTRTEIMGQKNSFFFHIPSVIFFSLFLFVAYFRDETSAGI